MASSTTNGSEDVNDFLQRIKELGDQRNQEDEARNRKLEDEILQGRKERQARRAERARSISPTKSSPSTTPTVSRNSALPSSLSQSTLPPFETQDITESARDSAIDNAMDRLTGSPKKENAAPFQTDYSLIDTSLGQKSPSKASPSSAIPSRTPTMSWQQRRPNSQASDRVRSRPLSMVATENSARSPQQGTPESLEIADETPTRDQIAQSLSSKDPSWFRQTADRGLNSPAYRKPQIEDGDRLDHMSDSVRRQMPGMSREDSQSDEFTDQPLDRSSSPSRSRVSYESGSRASQQGNTGTTGLLGSPLALTPAHRLEPPGEIKSDSRALAMSPSQGRISPGRLDRPPSPTKGMGGFVQSAMMKRSDSVSKRWSVQSPPGLSKGNSMESSRSSHESGSAVTSALRDSRQLNNLSRDHSQERTSRPSSCHSNTTVTQERPSTSDSATSIAVDDGFVQSNKSISSSRAHTQGEKSFSPRGDAALPTSPTKTMDSRRWSPTKSSWLESALNKPDSPKPKPAPPPQQPAWMSEINKAKQRGSFDLGRSPTTGPKHQVAIGGLMRSPPAGMANRKQTIGGVAAGIPTGMAPKTQKPEYHAPQHSGKHFPKPEAEAGTKTRTTTAKSSPVSGNFDPEMPPTKDFRAGLKSRQPPPDTSGIGEPEFKNVFGQLRKTKTQNYVAPDELKDNITRGKMALNVTGGPKKTERKDEFREAILKKKDDFKKTQAEGKGITRSTTGGSQEIPEALAKRKAMERSGSITTSEAGNMDLSPTRQSQQSSRPYTSKETTAPNVQGRDSTGSKLAGRFNPALASLLARGPPSMASDTSRPSSPASSQRNLSISTSSTNAESSKPGPQLSHMTKDRARGPKRKAPSSAPTTAAKVPAFVDTHVSSLPVDGPISASLKPEASIITSTNSSSQDDIENPTSQSPSPRKLDFNRRSQFLQESPNKDSQSSHQSESSKPLSPSKTSPLEGTLIGQERHFQSKPATPKAKPASPIKSPSLSDKSSIKRPADVEKSPKTKPLPKTLSPIKVASTLPIISAPASSNRQPTPGDAPVSPKKHGRGESVSVKNVAALWSAKQPNELSPIKSPIKLPTQADENAALVDAGLRSASAVKSSVSTSLGIQTAVPVTSTRPLTASPKNGSMSPPGASDPSLAISPRSLPSPVPQTSEASRLLSSFFGDQSSSPKFVADTTSILLAKTDEGNNIKTLRSSLYHLSADGKKTLVPSHQERILFEGNTYVCTHTFGNSAGKKVTEVYYWVGGDVPSTVADEATIFAQREAKSVGGNLVKIRQGKETPEFFAALGGIIIIRRGSSNKYDSLAPHILCGRKHFGQIAFDEVDFSPSSLCSGFPYLIAAQSGKSYLWKGKGSGIDELSCARLIGMDFGLTGEIEEVEDGSEPSSFLQIFGNDSKIPKSADHWRMKPNYSKYCGRLFCADSTAKEQILEISPFCQSDFDASKVYILDAFFEIYVIVGCRAQSQYDSFHNALTFAQEYGILAAGMEDRPFVPVTTVILEGVPRDLKSVFRKWVDELAPTIESPQGDTLQRGRSLRVVPLTAALEATKVS